MMLGLVEGLGDAQSIPHLLSKAGKSHLTVKYIDMSGKSNIVRLSDGFEKTIVRQIELGYEKFFILIDADVYFYPYDNYTQEVQGMKERVGQLKNAYPQIEIKLFWAIKNYESWLIGGLSRGDRFCELSKAIKGIAGDTQAHPSEPKKWIKDHRSDGRYNTDVQLCLTKHFNVRLAKQRNNSLRNFIDRI